jgi:secondary thiamine-phosphate synthase enzyme
MPVKAGQFQVQTQGFCDVVNISDQVRGVLADSGLQNGIACVSVAGSTAAVTTIEFEAGCIEDLKKAIERLVPSDMRYAHDSRWGDGNGFSHVRAALVGGSYTLPFQGGTLLLGTWQQLVLADFDNRPRRRNVMVQLVGE